MQAEICPRINLYSNTVMKRTMFISMLAAALVGGQVFAADAILTKVEGATRISNSYYGVRNTSGEANGANVTVSASETGDDLNRVNVYGGNASTEASNNKITMTGGQVQSLYGAQGNTTVSGNTVIMTEGIVSSSLRGGHSIADKTELVTPLVEKNVVIVAGDCELGSVYGGYSSHGYAKDNKVYLVGKGATATITDAQGITKTYDGGTISVKQVRAGEGDSNLDNNSIGNSIDIYGTGITASGYVKDMQILNFHISQNQIGGEDSMLTLTTYGMDLTNVTIGIQDVNVDVQAWTTGTTVTLVQTKKVITGIESGQEVNIKQGDQVVAQGKLVLSDDNMTLSLSIPGSVPEPTTGTLGLLALGLLAGRRSKK